jgi:hypothetical protein
MPNWKKVIVSGSDASLNSLYVNNGITGSLEGTASFAVSSSFSTTSSFTITASYASEATSASYAFNSTSSSYALLATTALTASYIDIPLGQTAHLVQSVSANTWSFAHNLNDAYPVVTVYDDADKVIIPLEIESINVNTLYIYFSTPRTGNATAVVGGTAITASYTVSSSYAAFATTASFALDFNPSATASYALEALTSSFALEAITASYALEALTSSFAQTASYVDTLNQDVTIDGIVVLTQVSESLNFADDTAAAAGGVPLGGLYRNGNFILIRLV